MMKGATVLPLLLLALAGGWVQAAAGRGQQAASPALAAATPGALRTLQARLAADGRDYALALQVARAAVDLGRREGDPRRFLIAQGALRPWLAGPGAPAEALVLRATVRQHEHDFDGCLADLHAALRVEPNHPGAWLTKATVETVTGDYSAARRSVYHVLRTAGGVEGATAAAYLGSLTGNARSSYRLLREEVGRQPAPSGRGEVAAWTAEVLADIAARTGDAAAAERHYEDALAAGGERPGVLVAYAGFLVDQGRPGEALDLLGERTRPVEVLLARALAEQALPRPPPTLPRLVGQLGEHFRADRAAGEHLHLRAEAAYWLHLRGDPHRALGLARENWLGQREPDDTRLLLQAAAAAGAAAVAAEVQAWRQQHGQEDARGSIGERPEK